MSGANYLTVRTATRIGAAGGSGGRTGSVRGQADACRQCGWWRRSRAVRVRVVAADAPPLLTCLPARASQAAWHTCHVSPMQGHAPRVTTSGEMRVRWSACHVAPRGPTWCEEKLCAHAVVALGVALGSGLKCFRRRRLRTRQRRKNARRVANIQVAPVAVTGVDSVGVGAGVGVYVGVGVCMAVCMAVGEVDGGATAMSDRVRLRQRRLAGVLSPGLTRRARRRGRRKRRHGRRLGGFRLGLRLGLRHLECHGRPVGEFTELAVRRDGTDAHGEGALAGALPRRSEMRARCGQIVGARCGQIVGRLWADCGQIAAHLEAEGGALRVCDCVDRRLPRAVLELESPALGAARADRHRVALDVARAEGGHRGRRWGIAEGHCKLIG